MTTGLRPAAALIDPIPAGVAARGIAGGRGIGPPRVISAGAGVGPPLRVGEGGPHPTTLTRPIDDVVVDDLSDHPEERLRPQLPTGQGAL